GIAGFNFGKDNTGRTTWADSVENPKLIYIIGGSQRRFMEVVYDTPVYEAIHQAFKQGTTISGTSAGGAVMSEVMEIGHHIEDMKTYNIKSIKYDHVRTIDGLGLLPPRTIRDQHFIKRGRFNRLISVLADYPTYECLGIDESTAVLYHDGKAEVVGEG